MTRKRSIMITELAYILGKHRRPDGSYDGGLNVELCRWVETNMGNSDATEFRAIQNAEQARRQGPPTEPAKYGL